MQLNVIKLHHDSENETPNQFTSTISKITQPQNYVEIKKGSEVRFELGDLWMES